MTQIRTELSENEEKIVNTWLEEMQMEARGAVGRTAKRMRCTSSYVSQVVNKWKMGKETTDLQTYAEVTDMTVERIRSIYNQLGKRAESIDKLEHDEEELMGMSRKLYETLEHLQMAVHKLEDMLEDDSKDLDDKALREHVRAINRLLTSKFSPMFLTQLYGEHRENIMTVNKIIDSLNASVFKMQKIQDLLFNISPDLWPEKRQMEVAEWYMSHFCKQCPGNDFRLKDWKVRANEIVINPSDIVEAKVTEVEKRG